jgi:hypothetical protein
MNILKNDATASWKTNTGIVALLMNSSLMIPAF